MRKNQGNPQRSRNDSGSRSQQDRGRSGRQTGGDIGGKRNEPNEDTRSANRRGKDGGMSSPGRRGSQRRDDKDIDRP